MKEIIKVHAGYINHAASISHIYIRVNSDNKLELEKKFYIELLKVRKEYINWWGCETVYNIEANLKRVVTLLQDQGEDIELVDMDNNLWSFQLSRDDY